MHSSLVLRLTSVTVLSWLSLLSGLYGEPLVDTNLGTVLGESVHLENGNVIDTFLGIPYAKPPIGSLRFERTQVAEPWQGTFNATRLGSTCMQNEMDLWLTHPGWDNYDEDCLNLNIYSKQRESEELMAVMVWFHGGAFQSGANIAYPGYFLAEHDVLVITVSYRLNIFGFGTTEDEIVPGNMGLWDMIMALEFVRDNALAFGGDPNSVTIFGQSAGGAAVGFLISSPLATGLFHKAILSSGTELSRRALHRSYTTPSRYLQDAAVELGCPIDDTAVMIACMKDASAHDLRDTSFNCTKGSPSCWGHQPVVDGEVIPEHPYYLHEQGRVNQVPEMVGLMSRDAFFFLPDSMEDGITREELEQEWRDLVDWFSVFWPDSSRKEDAFQAQCFMYTDWPYINDSIRNRDMLGEWKTDDYYGANADLQAKFSASRSQPVYFYVNNIVLESRDNDWKGAMHSDDNEFIFGYPYLWENPEALRNSEFVKLGPAYTERDRNNSKLMMELWTNFAKYGNPTPVEEEFNSINDVIWPEYNSDNHSFLWLDNVPEVAMNYRQKEYAYWTEYLRYLMWGETFP